MMTKSRILVSLASLALLVACGAESDRALFPLEAERFANSEWSDPVNLGAPVNSSANDMNATLSPDELSLYFVSTRAGGLGGADIWVSRRASLDSPWEEPVNLGPDVNTAAFEAGGFYLQSAEEGSVNLYFVRGPNSVALDIYVAPINTDGEARGPAVLVTELSNQDPAITDAHPSLRADGREIYFHSNRAGSLGASDLWRSTRRSVHDPWSTPENLGAPLSSTANDVHPSLSHDARTLIFASTRAGGLGGSDIWMSTRTSSGN